MSADTKATLENALAAHISDESETMQMITGFVLGVAMVDLQNDNHERHSYWFEASNGQPSHITRGLADILNDWAGSSPMFGDDDDDE